VRAFLFFHIAKIITDYRTRVPTEYRKYCEKQASQTNEQTANWIQSVRCSLLSLKDWSNEMCYVKNINIEAAIFKSKGLVVIMWSPEIFSLYFVLRFGRERHHWYFLYWTRSIEQTHLQSTQYAHYIWGYTLKDTSLKMFYYLQIENLVAVS